MLDEAQVVADAPAADAQVTASESQPGRPPVLKPIMNESWFGKPVEEVDPFVVDDVKLTFCVISKKYNRHYIYRFSCSKSLFVMGPLNPLRKFAIYVTTHRWFDILIVLTILANCITLAMITNVFDLETGEKIEPSYDFYIDRIEYAFLAIYTIELVMKVLAKGLILNKYSYLRNRWNILDMVVVASSYTTLIEDFKNTDGDLNADDNGLDFLRTFRVLRAVKTMSILPGLRMMINALLNSVVHLVEVMVLTLVCLIIFAVFALEVFQGKLRQKCVMDKGGPMDVSNTPIIDEPEADRDRLWTEWVMSSKNWLKRSFPEKEPTQCGNDSDTRQCGLGYTCLGAVGENPDDGWTSFDNFFNSLLSSFQLLTLDYWERLYDIVVSSCGFWSLLWFLLVIFFGAYYLLNLMLAVVSMSYENEAQVQDQGPMTAPQRLGVNRRQSNFSFDELSKINICKMTHYRKRTKSERELLAKRLKMTASGEWLDDDGLPSGKDNLHLDDAIFNLLGMRMNLGTDDKPARTGLVGQIALAIEKEEEEEAAKEAKEKVKEQEDLNSANRSPLSIQEGSRLGNNPDVLSTGTDKLESRSDVEMDWGEGREKKRSIADEWKAKIALKFRIYLQPVVNHNWFEMFITLCIVVNTVVLAMEHHGASKELEDALKLGNHIFMAVFTAEFILKLLALQREYFQIGWNIFDMLIVLISYLDLAVADSNNGSRGLSVLRSMRLLRVFKLAQSWITMKILLNTIFSSFGALGNLICVLFIVIYIFAVMGMQMVGEQYTPDAFEAKKNPMNFPKWHWRHFWYAFMMVFRVLCGEWIEPLWECLKAQTHHIEKSESSHASGLMQYGKCFLIFLPILIVGNFIVLNLFLALLLNSFDTEELNAQREKQQDSKQENLKAIVGILLKKEEGAGGGDSDHGEHMDDGNANADGDENGSNGKRPSIHKPVGSPGLVKFRQLVQMVIMMNRKNAAELAIARMENRQKKRNKMYAGLFLKNPAYSGEAFEYDRTPEETVDSELIKMAGECFPAKIWEWKYCICRKKPVMRRRESMLDAWDRTRGIAVTIVGHPTFEWGILILIFASSITLCFEDVDLDTRPVLKRVLCILNFAFTGIFFIEMILKWFAIGIWGYFTSFWTLLDAFIVTVSLVSVYFDITMGSCPLSVMMGIAGNVSGAPPVASAAKNSAVSNLGALKALRTLRALRPLRAISRWEGMKMVVNALLYAIPSIFNVLLVCLLFWLIFSIMGVQFFKGQFYRCVDEEGSRIDSRIVPNKDVCCAKAETHGFSWVNTISNYDNVVEGYLSLLQIATFEGWMELMSYSVDATGVDKQPVMDYQIEYYAFYVVFIIFGSFFTLQLFIGVIIDNFNMLKKKYEGNMVEILLTPTQRSYYIAMKNLGKRRPEPVIPKPKFKFLEVFYHITMSRQLEIFIFVMIFLNLGFEAIEVFNQSQKIDHIMQGCGAFFTVVYMLEATVKIIGLGSYYFTVPWNVYDFALCVASGVDIFIGDVTLTLPVPPTMLRVVRLIRIGKIFRLIKSAQGLRKLLYALVVSIPALFNIGALLALITFIYSILGMALFNKAPRKWSIDNMFNFETFVSSNLMLLRLMTAAGWNEVLDSLTVVEPVCGYYRHLVCGLEGETECPNRALVVAYIVSYLVLTYLIVINLYIAIILENYAEATNEEDVGIVDDDLEMFYARWAIYDPYATQFIDFDSLTDFLDTLDPPLKVPKPNLMAIVSYNVPIARGNKIHCLDILRALINHVLGEVDDSREFRKLQSQMERKFQKQFPTRRLLDIVSSSRRWKIEQNAAIIIQRAWRAYWKRTHPDESIDHATQTRRSLENGGPTHGGMGHMMNKMGNVPDQTEKPGVQSAVTGIGRKSSHKAEKKKSAAARKEGKSKVKVTSN